MDGRLTLLVGCLLLVPAGCKHTSKSASPHAPPTHPHAQAPVPPVDTKPKDDGKREPRLAVAWGALKEAEARKLDHQPETQFKVRDQARKFYQEAIKLDPGSIEAHRGLSRVYVDLGDFARAQETLRKAQAKFPKESIFWFEQAQLHNRKKEFSEAAKSLHRALEIDPENRMYITTLGLTMARNGMADQAVTVLARSMGPAGAHYNVARMLLHLQRHDEAAFHLRRAVQTNPNLEEARRLLAQLEGGGRPNVNLDIDAGQ
jgi:tetratricopeptide (TPR) repeat protein